MRADRKSVKLLLLEMAAKGRPRPLSRTALYEALQYHYRANHAFRTKLNEVRPDWAPKSRDPAAPIKNTRATGGKYRAEVEEMALMGADKPKLATPEGRALYYLCRTDVAFKAMIMQTTNWDVRTMAERRKK